jgi:hypothetical protein
MTAVGVCLLLIGHALRTAGRRRPYVRADRRAD